MSSSTMAADDADKDKGQSTFNQPRGDSTTIAEEPDATEATRATETKETKRFTKSRRIEETWKKMKMFDS